MPTTPDLEIDEYETPRQLVRNCLIALTPSLEKEFNTFLDPCTGRGNWFNELQLMVNHTGKINHYCEILEGLDFYKVTDKYDVIYGNPPFSQLSKWLEHSRNQANFVIAYLLPAHALSHKRLSLMEDFGWSLKSMHSIKNPKEWNLGFAHFFCIWIKTEKDEGDNYVLPQMKIHQSVLGDFL
ncbi:MAG: dimethyladenosine transferase [Circular genetic element sp.]|nr:MAG: dimethyladenosine transferase [Circular genetic element sp.]